MKSDSIVEQEAEDIADGCEYGVDSVAGTDAALLEAGEFVHVLHWRQGQLIAAPEEIAFNTG